MRRVPLVVALALGLLASGASAQTLREPASGVNFAVARDLLGKRHTCIGVGLRKVLAVVKVYAAGLYLEDETARPGFQQLLAGAGGDLDALRASPKLLEWLIGGDFGKSLEWVFVRDLERGKMAKTIRESLEREIGDLGAPELRDAARKLLDALDVPLRKWQRLVIVQRPGWQITALLEGKPVASVTSRTIAQAIWRIYLGPRPVQADLKRNLVLHIENVK
jgi:hypothetical protein